MLVMRARMTQIRENIPDSGAELSGWRSLTSCMQDKATRSAVLNVHVSSKIKCNLRETCSFSDMRDDIRHAMQWF